MSEAAKGIVAGEPGSGGIVRTAPVSRCPFQLDEANQLRFWLARRGRRIDYIFGMVSVNEALEIEILTGILALAFGQQGWDVVFWLIAGAVVIAGVNTFKAIWWRL